MQYEGLRVEVNKMRLMLLTDPIIDPTHPTAYSKVGFNLASRCNSLVAHTPMSMAFNMGITEWKLNNGKKILLYPSGQTPFAEDRILQNSLHFNADMVLAVKDMWAFNAMLSMPLEVAYYAAIDHSPASPYMVNKLATAFQIIVPSYFAQKELDRSGIPSTYIPHGFNPEYYKPLEDRAINRQFFHIGADEFVVGFVGKNQTRKMIPRFLQGFKYAKDMYPDVSMRAFIWTDVNDEIPLIPIMRELGLEQDVYWAEHALYAQGIPESEMGKLYNCFDVTAGVAGEGFWLPGLESQACGVPCICANYGASPEIVKSGYTVDVKDHTYNNVIGVRQPLIDLGDFALKVGKILNGDPEKFRKQAVEGVKDFTWDKIVAEKFQPWLDKCELLLKPKLTKKGISSWEVAG